jgi:RHS repeat-associated protein
MQPCDTADFNRDGEVNGDDITAFIAAKQGTYFVPAGDIGDYRFLYRGYWYDRHLHIYHVRHRAYDPETQRWLQPDPAYFVDGLNRYAYCGNEPVHMYDPMGLWGEQIATRIANSGGWYAEAVGYGVGIAGAMQESVATSLISIVNPMTYINAVQNAIAREDAHAARGVYETTIWYYVLAVTGEFVGANELADAGFYGIDVIDGREVAGWERFERGAGGAVQMVGTAAGSAAGALRIHKALASTRTVDPLMQLRLLATEARDLTGPGKGAAYGTRVHSMFEKLVNSLGGEFTTEVSYLNGQIVKRGTRGSIRLDVVEGPLSTPRAIYDLKTGTAALTKSRIAEIRSHLPAGCSNTPIYEVRP